MSHSSLCLLMVLALQPNCFAQDAALAEQVQGEYLKGSLGIQVAATGDAEYRVTFFEGGLPGAGWNRGPTQTTELDHEAVSDLLNTAERQERHGPSLGAKPPTGAIVLFDGTSQSVDQHWQSGAKLVEGNLLQAGATTQKRFNDYRLHLEFRTPFSPKSEGQGRGNSGVYHQARYETQVLDSFGFDNESNTCGAIYGIQAADFNACLPPLAWQTYDIEFVAARWDAAGKKTAEAKLSVWLNGFPIHRDQSVPNATTAAPNAESPAPGPLYLQDHGNSVTYRNIWLVPIDADQVALRPRVSGFERLHTTISNDEELALSGRLLISELGCVACHDPGLLPNLDDSKQAPLLKQAGARLKPGYIASMLADVHRSKLGTTMPDLLHGLDAKNKSETIEAISAFVESTGKSRRHSRSDRQASERGQQLYSRIGCAVCHGFPDGNKVTSTSVPLPEISKKYTFDGLALFLKQPHQARPSNRMPGMQLDDNEVRDLAHFLLPTVDPADARPDTRFSLYHGEWNKLPDFDKLTAITKGTTEGFDLGVADRNNNYAVRFDTFLTIDTAGEYRFHLGSDDGSKLYVDGKTVVDVDGIHPHQTSSNSIRLDAGTHSLRVEYFQGGGEATLDVQWESDSFVRQSLDGWLTLDRDGAKSPAKESVVDPSIIEKGKILFTKVGCGQCHKMPGLLSSTGQLAKAPRLDQCNPEEGCLAQRLPAGIPDYRLSFNQKEAIRAALQTQPNDELAESQRTKFALHQLNCVACHQRDGWGGPESDKLELFQSTIPEMGDEGRLPPRLTGVGDKLNDKFLAKVLAEGARHRPYMHVRMPQYHEATNGLADHWKKTDRPSDDRIAHAATEPEVRTLAAGRQLAGIKGLSCAQCHTFGNQKAIGIQAIGLLSMTERLRPEWFYRYLMEPTKYRPGTRMPASFPDGSSVLKTVYDGNAEHQIAALWKYLAQGDKASIPEGLLRDQMVLEPKDRPILYRNFLEGLSARGIAVGYPGGLNIAWDAESMSLSKAWQGQFIDASMHWRDRGVGRQRPLGDLILSFETVSPVAILDNPETVWPTSKQITKSHHFKGYRLDHAGYPTFRYQIDGIEVLDRPDLILSQDGTPGLKRTLTVQSATEESQTKNSASGKLWLRLAEGNQIRSEDANTWLVDDQYRVTIPASFAARASIRNSNNRQELVMPIESLAQPFNVEYVVRW
ncbi:MAG: family 16 glycoside hydrolase [Planctomycetota bacterium]